MCPPNGNGSWATANVALSRAHRTLLEYLAKATGSSAKLAPLQLRSRYWTSATLSDEVSPGTGIIRGKTRVGPTRQRDKLRGDGTGAHACPVDHVNQFGERLLRAATPKPDQHSDGQVDHFSRCVV